MLLIQNYLFCAFYHFISGVVDYFICCANCHRKVMQLIGILRKLYQVNNILIIKSGSPCPTGIRTCLLQSCLVYYTLIVTYLPHTALYTADLVAPAELLYLPLHIGSFCITHALVGGLYYTCPSEILPFSIDHISIGLFSIQTFSGTKSDTESTYSDVDIDIYCLSFQDNCISGYCKVVLACVNRANTVTPSFLQSLIISSFQMLCYFLSYTQWQHCVRRYFILSERTESSTILQKPWSLPLID